ncbi:MAG: YggS family pyridoxal phosphate-dependent enzyme [Candidatus Omnitrophota bacterium]
MFSDIDFRVKEILKEIPSGVRLVAASKTRTSEEIKQAVRAGIKIIGQNYVQEAERAYADIGHDVKWHFIGHLQKNKVKKAVEIFDVIETVDSIVLAREIDKRCSLINKTMFVFVEVNSARESQKSGVFPEKTLAVVKEIAELSRVRVQGLMTMGPFLGDPEKARPFFAETRKIFELIRAENIAGVEMKYLSMGMTNSYNVAIEEGANIIRIGTKIFGERTY